MQYLQRSAGYVSLIFRLLLVVDQYSREEDEETPVEHDMSMSLLVHVARVEGSRQIETLQKRFLAGRMVGRDPRHMDTHLV